MVHPPRAEDIGARVARSWTNLTGRGPWAVARGSWAVARGSWLEDTELEQRPTSNGPRATSHESRPTSHGPRATSHGQRATVYGSVRRDSPAVRQEVGDQLAGRHAGERAEIAREVGLVVVAA